MRLRPRQVQCARALHFGQTASVVHVSAYSFDTEALTWHSIYYESVLIFPKSSLDYAFDYVVALNAFDDVVALNALYDFVAASPVDYGAAANGDSVITDFAAAAGSTARSTSADWLYSTQALGSTPVGCLTAILRRGWLPQNRLLRRNPVLTSISYGSGATGKGGSWQ